jgi:hypothetical protein
VRPLPALLRPLPAPARRRYQTQTFNATANQATSSLLFLSCIAIIIPTAATSFAGDGSAGQEWILELSRGTAVVLLVIYACYLVGAGGGGSLAGAPRAMTGRPRQHVQQAAGGRPPAP